VTTLELIQSNLIVLLIWAGFIGACIGSFLNVVIYRIPRMLKRDWRKQCHEFLEQAIDTEESSHETFNLITPRSQCMQCNKTIPWYHNIPLLSFLLLRGKCAQCKAPFSSRYFFIECITTLLSLYIVYQFGFSFNSLVLLLATYLLLCMTFIDFDEQILPDEFTQLFLWLGLLSTLHPLFISPKDAIIGATAGYLFLYILTKVYYFVTKRQGMGHGDFKLAAGLGAFVGWQGMPFVIFISAILGTIVGFWLILFKRGSRHTAIPFGPYLAIAGWVYLLFHQAIINFYVTWLL
jgi:leader peptidase (prepilin peptidase)/N-methyltransferase